VATMDIFEGDAFSIIELTRALENIPFKPAILSGAGLFGSRGVRTRSVMIESRDGTLQLIPFSERGSAFESQIPERRDMRAFVVRQFKKQDVLWASEIQGIRDFGSETAVQQVQTEVARKLGRLRNDAEATFEFHLFNGIQGVVKDPRDGATVINYYTEFNITPAAEVDFDLDNATPGSGALRKRCQALIESIRLDQASFFTQFRFALMRALASSISFRMSTVMATFGGFPALIMAWYLALRSGLCLIATRAGM